MDLWQRNTGPEKAFGRGTRRLRPRTIAFFVLFVPLLAIGGWLFLKYAPLLTEKSQPGKPMPQSKGAIATGMSAGAAPAPKKTDLTPKASSPPIPRTAPRKQKTPTRKTVVTSRTGVRVLEKKGGKPPPARVDSRSFQTPGDPKSASGLPSRRDVLVLKKDDKAYPPPGESYPLPNAGKPAVDESSVLTGFSVQAIAWSKIPAERIAVINGVVMREGGFVEGIQVTQIGIDEVSLKKGEKTWLLKCGR